MYKKRIAFLKSTDKESIQEFDCETETNNQVQEVEATDGEDFQDYQYLSGKRVPNDTRVGYELYNEREKVWELVLFSDIDFA